MDILIVGHSFIRRLEDYHWRLTTEAQAPTPFPLSGHNVHFLGIGGATLTGPKSRQLQQRLTPSLAGKCDLVYIALGTNDLAQGSLPSQVAQHLVSLANYLMLGLEVKCVILEQIIPRCENKFPGFRLLAQQTNEAIQDLLATSEYQNIKIWKHTGFWNPQTPLLCKDGVHFNQVGMYKYWRSVRGAILWAGHNH